MAGFLLNGCGAQDYFKKMKCVGQKMCPTCNSMRTFNLEKVKFKVTVVFIPTISLSEKYAVMCESCRQGYYISEQEMHKIMAQS